MAFSQQSPDALMPGMLQFCVETKIKIVLLQREVPSTSRGGQAHAHVPMRLGGRLPQRWTVPGGGRVRSFVLLVGTQVEWQEAHVRRTMTELAHLESSATRIEADVMDVPQRSAPRCPVFAHTRKSPALPPAVLCGLSARGRDRRERCISCVWCPPCTHAP
jgi:hypothetical protein